MKPPISELLVDASKSLEFVLRTLNKNAEGIAFVVESNGRLVGSITDGDVRRALLAGASLSSSVLEIANRSCVSLPVDSTQEKIAATLNDTVSQIPLVDDSGVVVDYAAFDRMRRFPVMEPYLNGNEQAYVMDCLKTKWISSQGKYVNQFERMFEDALRVPHGTAVAVSNGTVALHVALVSLGIGSGDEVIVPDLTFAASANAVIHSGATPVLVDVERESWCLDPDLVEAAINPRTRAILPVHLYGKSANMDRISAIARRHGLLVIEDAAQALGSEHRSQPLGTFGDAASFSFFANKVITTGEGGMVVFRDQANSDRAMLLRDHGMSKERRYWHEHVGYNYRMTNLQAAIGVAQLEQLQTILDRKQAVARQYMERLGNVSGLRMPPGSTAGLHEGVNVYWLFTILVDGGQPARDHIMRRLHNRGIETRAVFYPLSTMPLYRTYARHNHQSVAQQISQSGLSLPSAAGLGSQEIDCICDVLISELQLCQDLALFASN